MYIFSKPREVSSHVQYQYDTNPESTPRYQTDMGAVKYNFRFREPSGELHINAAE